MERAYEATVTLRFVVEADDTSSADALAEKFAWGISGWIDASGVPPWTIWTMVTRTDVESIDAQPRSTGLRVVTEKTLGDALGA